MGKLLVQDLMTSKVRTVRPEDDLLKLRDLMDDLNVRHVPVVTEAGELVGLVSQRDLLRSGGYEGEELPLGLSEDMMSRVKVSSIVNEDIESVEPGTDVRVAAQVMLDNKYGCLPVLESGALVGIVTESDFVRYVADGG